MLVIVKVIGIVRMRMMVRVRVRTRMMVRVRVRMRMMVRVRVRMRMMVRVRVRMKVKAVMMVNPMLPISTSLWVRPTQVPVPNEVGGYGPH